MDIHLCDYGCGKEAKYKFANGKWCCETKFQKCPGHINNKREQIRKKTIEYYRNETPEQKENRVNAHKKFWTKKNKKIWSEKSLIYNKKNKRTIKKIQKIYPIFYSIEEMRYNPDKPGRKEIQVHCRYNECENSKEKGGWFTPTSREIERRIAALDYYGTGGRNFYCSDECKQKCPIYGFNPNYDFIKDDDMLPYTSSEYNTFKQEVLKRQKDEYGYNFCEKCEKTEQLHIHHEKPQKTHSFMSLDPDNGIVLCKDCHLKEIHIGECSPIYLHMNCKKE